MTSNLLSLLILATVIIAHAQQGTKPGSSTSTRPSSAASISTPFACFYNECKQADPPEARKDFVSCLMSAFTGVQAKKVVLPGSTAFERAQMMVNTRFQHTPAAVVYAHKTSDVQAAVKCAYNNEVRVSVAGGRHSYEGWTVVDDYLLVDVSNMTQARVTGRNGSVLTVEVGPGNTNALLISQLHKAGYSTAGTIIGQCPSVGVSGFILGGGQGDLSRMFGLACDQLVGLELVTFRGDVVTASAQHNSDLLWASCGGGGGLGVVTQWTVKAHDLGNQPFSKVQVRYNIAAIVPAMLKFQDFIMSNQTDLRFSGGGARLGGFTLYFAGPLATAMRLLREGGLLNPVWLDKSVKSSALQSRAHLNQAAVPIDPSAVPDMPPEGVATAMQFENYYETIMHAECLWVAGPDINPNYGINAAKFGLGPGKSCSDPAVLGRYKTLAAQAVSPINVGISDVWRSHVFASACRLLPPLNQTAWEAMIAVRTDPRCSAKRFAVNKEQLSRLLQEDPDSLYYCMALTSMGINPTWNHLLGGAVAKVAPSATAYPWRKAISPLCFDSGLLNDMSEADGYTLKKQYDIKIGGQDGASVTVSPAAMAKAIQEVQKAYLGALYRVLGADEARKAYLNYQTDQVQDYAEAYWGPNYNRLRQIKTKWDPEGVFSKPFTVQPAMA